MSPTAFFILVRGACMVCKGIRVFWTPHMNGTLRIQLFFNLFCFSFFLLFLFSKSYIYIYIYLFFFLSFFPFIPNPQHKFFFLLMKHEGDPQHKLNTLYMTICGCGCHIGSPFAHLLRSAKRLSFLHYTFG